MPNCIKINRRYAINAMNNPNSPSKLNMPIIIAKATNSIKYAKNIVPLFPYVILLLKFNASVGFLPLSTAKRRAKLHASAKTIPGPINSANPILMPILIKPAVRKKSPMYFL